MARSRSWIWQAAVMALLLVATAGAAWAYIRVDRIRDHADPDRARKKDLPIPVRTVVVAETEVDEPVGGTAITAPSQVANIQIGASRGFTWVVSDIRLKAVHVWNGAPVRKGEVMFEVEDALFNEVLKQAQSEFSSASSNLAQKKEAVVNNETKRKLELTSAETELHYRVVDLDNRKHELDTIKKLQVSRTATDFQLYDIMSKFEKAGFDRSEAERRLEKARDEMKVGPLTDKAELDSAQAKFDKASADLALAKHDMERGQIRSPIDGFVDVVTVVPGSEVPVSQPLTKVLKLDPVFVVMDFPQERSYDVAVGQKAEVVLDSNPKETLEGKVVRILPQANPQLRVLAVTIEVPNPGNRIKADVSGYARIWVKRKAATVPAAAVIRQGDKAMAFVVKDGRAHIRAVRAGLPGRVGELAVADGLAAGEEVVVFNQYYLQDNDSVDTDWRKWARRD